MCRQLLGLLLIMLTGSVAAGGFTLSSKDFDGQLGDAQVYNGFGCHGKNRSPSLHWSNAPEGTRSFAVTVFDPDAPTGSGWWHWLIFNIPASSQGLRAGAGDPAAGVAPDGSVQSLTDFGKPGFGGACPPPGDRPHRYIFTVYALDVADLDLDAGAQPARVGFAINRHALAKASLVAYYAR